MAFSKAFGDALRAARTRAELSQERLAHRAGVHPVYVSQVERGVKSPTLEVVSALSRALGESPHKLIQAAEQNMR